MDLHRHTQSSLLDGGVVFPLSFHNAFMDTLLTCMLPTSVTIQLSSKQDTTMEEIKSRIWQAAAALPLYNLLQHQRYYSLVYVNITGEQEVVYDEHAQLNEVNPFAGVLRVVLKTNNAHEKSMDSQISALINKGLHEYDQIQSEEVQEFRQTYRKKCENIMQKRALQNLGLEEKICAVYPPDFYSDNPKDDLHPDLKTRLEKGKDILFDITDRVNERPLTVRLFMAYDEFPQSLVPQAMARLKASGKKFRSDRSDDYVIKICGREEYLIGNGGDRKLYHYRHIYNCILKEERPIVRVVDMDTIIDQLPIPALPPKIPRKPPSLRPKPTVRANRSCSLFDVDQNFSVYIDEITKLNVEDGSKLMILCGLFHGNVSIETLQSAEVDVHGGKAVVNSELAFQITVSNLPLMARIGFQIVQTFGFDGTLKKKSSKKKNLQDVVPIAWANTTLFDYKQNLVHGSVSLTTWPCTVEASGINFLGTVVANPSMNKTILSLRFSDYDRKQIRYPSFETMLEIAAAERVSERQIDGGLIERVCTLTSDILTSEYEEEEKAMIWEAREEILHEYPERLPQLLSCVKWSSYKDVAQLHALLQIWPKDKIPSSVALELLDFMYADKPVRDYALECLKGDLRDADLNLYLMQLVQTLKYESYLDCPLIDFLLVRALQNPRVGHNFFWLLRAEMHIPEVSLRFGLYLEAYCRGSPQQVPALQKQLTVLVKLKSITTLVKSSKYDDKRDLAKADMQRVLKEIGDTVLSCFVSPLDPRAKVGPLKFSNCKVMDSKMKPLWLHWTNFDQSGPDLVFLFKDGDDLRQDMLTLQMIHIMDGMWKAEGMDLRMTVYGCLSMDHMVGMIEAVQHSNTIANIQKMYGTSITSAFKKEALYMWLEKKNSHETSLAKAIDNFTLSCAGYCVATYVLGVGDRHSDNIMLKETGELVHIDFGHFLGNFKSKFGVKRERVPFVLVPDFVHIIKKGEANNWKRFQDLCQKAFLTIRRHGKLFVNLFMLMLSTGIPELSSVKDIGYLQDTLVLHLSEQDAAKHFQTKLTEALRDSWTTRVNWAAHNAAKDNT